MQDIRFSSHCIQQCISLINTLPDNTDHSKITKEEGTVPLPNTLRKSERNCDVTSTCCVTSTFRDAISVINIPVQVFFNCILPELILPTSKSTYTGVHVPDRLLRGYLILLITYWFGRGIHSSSSSWYDRNILSMIRMENIDSRQDIVKSSLRENWHRLRRYCQNRISFYSAQYMLSRQS